MNAHGRRYSQKIREAALRKWEGGKTPKEIAKEMGIGLQTLLSVVSPEDGGGWA